MKGLVLDTSLNKSFALIIEDDQISNYISFDNVREISQSLPSSLARAIKGKKLDFIAVGIGPGSYTGMRVSASIAQALSYAWKIPLIPFCSLLGYLPEKESSFCTLFDAKMGGFYHIAGVKTSKKINYMSQPCRLSIDEATELLDKKKYLITSPHAEKIKNRLNIDCIQTTINLDWLKNYLLNRFEHGDFSLQFPLNLLYLQPS